MNLSSPFILRPIMTTLAMIAIFIVGAICYDWLPISSMPNVNFPTINVRASYPGALPETMANSVALPLEKQFMAIPGLRIVSSNSILGSTSIALQFDVDKEMLVAAQDVQEAVSSAIPYLPADIPYGPTYRKVNPAEQPVIFIALTSPTLSRTDLYTYANTLIGQRISMLEGVSQVTTYGNNRAIRIQVDPVKLRSHGITLQEVADAVRTENVFLPTGQLDGVVEAPIIAVDGVLNDVRDYEEMVISYTDSRPIKIKDVGRAVESFQNNKQMGLFIDTTDSNKKSEPTVLLAIQKEPNANTVQIADGIYLLLDELKDLLPPAVQTHIIFDRSIPVREAIHDAIFTLCLSLVLVVLVIYFYFGIVADTVIPALVLPMSVVGTFIVMYVLDYTLDNLSVLALTIALGFIIDDAVVVMENIVRRVEAGESRLGAALKGSKEIGFTIVSMTLSLLAVFIPLLFMGGLIGKLFKEFAVTLATITVISGFISLTLTPMLCSRFLPSRIKSHQKNAVGRFSERLQDRLTKRYSQFLNQVVDHSKAALVVISLSLIATFLLFFYIPVDFVPNDDIGFFSIATQEIEGGSSYRLKDYQSRLVEILREDPSIDTFVSLSSPNEYRKGLNFVHLKPRSERPNVTSVIQNLNKKLASIEGLQSFIKNYPLIDLSVGQQSRSDYQFALQGLEPKAIYKSAKKIIEQMKKDSLFQAVNSDLEIDTPQINVTLLRDQAAQYGFTAADIERSFALSYSGGLISLIQTAVDQYNVILELYPELQRQIETLNQIWLRSPLTGSLVPLSATLNWQEGLGATSVNHINQFPSVTISFNLAPGVPLETALERLDEYSSQYMESNVTAQPIGAAKTFNESIKTSLYLLFITIFSIYIILGILYESFIHPITILTTLPPALLGGLLMLVIFNMPLSLYSFLGLILLIGIVKKNGIMIVDFALDNIRHRQMSARDAIIDASLVRFRPIMMTTLAAICGALPIALGFGANAEARRPLGIVIIGGLIVAQIVTLFVTPTLYLVLENLSEKLHKNKKL